MRKSQSNIYPKETEYLQGGILARKNIIEIEVEMEEGTITFYSYDEEKFDINTPKEEIDLWLKS